MSYYFFYEKSVWDALTDTEKHKVINRSNSDYHDQFPTINITEGGVPVEHYIIEVIDFSLIFGSNLEERLAHTKEMALKVINGELDDHGETPA
jgi:hypothetical protein